MIIRKYDDLKDAKQAKFLGYCGFVQPNDINHLCYQWIFYEAGDGCFFIRLEFSQFSNNWKLWPLNECMFSFINDGSIRVVTDSKLPILVLEGVSKEDFISIIQSTLLVLMKRLFLLSKAHYLF